MTLQMTVSPDFAPDKIGGWYVLATWLQRHLALRIHLSLHDNFEQQRAAIQNGQIDLIYANPYDAAYLVREQGYIAVAAPLHRADEVVLAVAAQASTTSIEQLRPGTRIAMVQAPEVNLIGRILLEPADLGRQDLVEVACSNYAAVAKQLLQGGADVGFFLKEAYQTLSSLTRKQLRPLVTSEISVVRHMLLAAPKLAELVPSLRETLSQSKQLAPGVLESLEFEGFEPLGVEDAEFMIDLIDTLIV